MEQFDVDLHIHSHHSIGVSKSMTIPHLVSGAKQKGLDVLGTGDVAQKDWLKHLEKHLEEKDECLMCNEVAFIPTLEVEDSEAIHHLIILPDLPTVDGLRRSLKPYSTNIDNEWGGRPRVNIRGEELVGFVRDANGMIGPAHAFTPFRSIFREGKHETLSTCYGKLTSEVTFLELGLSADTEIADCIPELRRLTYITSSDAHSPSPAKIGREFVRFEMEQPNYDEIRLAILRQKKRKPILNVGLNPRLGKYYLSFCSSCRRTVVLTDGDAPPEFDDLNIYISCMNAKQRVDLLRNIHARKVRCPADGKLLRLGVRDRAMMIGVGESTSPTHRPPYLHIPPLLELIAAAMGVRSSSSKKVANLYSKMRDLLGPETDILTSTDIEEIKEVNQKIARMIDAYRKGTVKYIAGGGGRYGRMIPPWEE